MNIVFFVQYQSNQPVKIETHYVGEQERRRPLEDVADMIGAFFLGVSPAELGQYKLSAVVGGVESALPGSQLLSLIPTASCSFDNPLILKSLNYTENTHVNLSRQTSDPWGNEVAVFIGRTGSSPSEGVTIGRETTVPRDETVDMIIEKLRQKNALMIKSPPMSGKTSTATLVSNRLKTTATEKCLIINLSTLEFSCLGEGWVFKSVFKKVVGVKWDDLGLLARNRTIYLIFDSVQGFYQPMPSETGPASPNNTSSCFWELVKRIMTTEKSNIRILLIGSYGSSNPSGSLSAPVVFKPESMLGIDWLMFSDAELEDYVVRNLDAAKQSNVFTDASVKLFCKNLKRVTGSHCGLCYAAVDYLNRVLCASGGKRHDLDADGVLKSLDDPSIYTYFQRTRAFFGAGYVSDKELELVSSVVFSEGMVVTEQALQADAKITAQYLVRKGVLVESGALHQNYVFSSPPMKRFFTEQAFDEQTVRAEENPDTLEDLVYAVLSCINYKRIKSSLGKTKILLERAWQMEFYNKLVQCTDECAISADVGGLFGTTGAIDFSVHSFDMEVRWGIELLREGIRLEDHAGQFGEGGRYEAMSRKFTSTCVLDIRRQPKEGSELDLKDLDKCENLIIFTYDDSFSSGVLYSKTWAEGRAVSFSS
ncbi:hypothetical protein HDU77_002015 [Chytriomyces hyalinus]|nr:hypothetical protein HDU77_002015 [Chytriomyces hyalinus]